MRELVCMAPDGSLEVWTLWQTESETLIWRIDLGIWGNNPKCSGHDTTFSPEFWGREILSDL